MSWLSVGKQNVFGIRNRTKKPLMLAVIFCYALIRNNINNSAIYSLNAALLNYRGPTTTGFSGFQYSAISPTNDRFLKPKNCYDIIKKI
jgi:hypothetical protein